ncbi:MAG: LTA synthase family protein [Alphaproteobacteria bacterium]|nr:MAG: LTA synthase family protein [Alphaproteobacteria bacterium]
MEPLALLHLGAGFALAALAWLLPRHIAGARWTGTVPLLLDAAPLALGVALLSLATGRPLFAGLIVLALAAGFALADHTMRQTLREPVVFSESVELPQVFTHPHLYLPFAGPGLVLGGAAAAVSVAAALLVFEPPLWTPRPALALIIVTLLAIAAGLIAREPLLGRAAAMARRLKPSGEPFADAVALGPFAMLLIHALIAPAERPARQCALGAPSVVGQRRGDAAPIVLVQCESFFDARRLGPPIGRDLLPAFDECRAAAAFSGRLEVPGWGANTMRTEFAVLTGIPETELGYDRFNPYYALARVPIASQVCRLRDAGYRTICVHPFDRRFFRRDLAMPALGFDTFLDHKALGVSCRPPYCSDPDLAHHVLRLLGEAGPRSFIFVITMGNHGPWLAKGPPIDSRIARLFATETVPDGTALQRYLDGLRRSDEMLAVLMPGLEQRRDGAILGFYGDHLPSLSQAFAHFGFVEPHSDYVVWPQGAAAPLRRDLPAHQLGRMIVDQALGPHSGIAADEMMRALATPS